MQQQQHADRHRRGRCEYEDEEDGRLMSRQPTVGAALVEEDILPLVGGEDERESAGDEVEAAELEPKQKVVEIAIVGPATAAANPRTV